MENKLRKHQLEAFEALCEVDDILKENNIPYFLLAGTTLGAVRHKGFIPWDDDIDIGIFIDNREKAYNLLEKKLSNKFIFKSIQNDEKFPRFFGKVICSGQGCIDVFLLVKTSNSTLLSESQWALRKVLFKLYKSKLGYINENEKYGVKNKIKRYSSKICSFLISRKRILKLVYWNEMRFSKKNAADNYINLYSAYSRKKEMIKKEWLEKTCEVEFEGRSFPTVCDTDAYLSKLYGDYMKLPPENQRKSGHSEIFK